MKKHHDDGYNNKKKLSQLCSRENNCLRVCFAGKSPSVSFAGKQLKPGSMRSEERCPKSWKDPPSRCRYPSNLILPIPPHSSEPGLSHIFIITTNFHFKKAISDPKLRCRSGYPCQLPALPLSRSFHRQGSTLQGDFLGVVPKRLT